MLSNSFSTALFASGSLKLNSDSTDSLRSLSVVCALVLLAKDILAFSNSFLFLLLMLSVEQLISVFKRKLAAEFYNIITLPSLVVILTIGNTLALIFLLHISQSHLKGALKLFSVERTMMLEKRMRSHGRVEFI